MGKWPKTPEQVADELQGTANSLSEVLGLYEMEGAENDQEFCDALDTHVFECVQCSWWCEISEMTEDPSNDWTCDECAPRLDD